MRALRIKGYTLVELLTSLTVAAILCNLCVSAFSATTARHNRNTTMQVVLTTLDRARSLAVMEGKSVVVCLLNSESQCDLTWSADDLGVFIDVNENHIRDENETVRYQQPWPTPNVKLRWGISFGGERIITYQADGSVRSNGTLSFLDHNNQVIQTIVISKPGRARITNN